MAPAHAGHRRSRLTQTTYCQQNGLHTKTYRTWCRKLEAEGTGEPLRMAAVGTRAMEGAEELAYPLLPASPSSRAELVGTVAQRQRYTVEERRQHVLMALQSGLPIERFARMSGSTPSALHGWKHKYAVRAGAPLLTAQAAAPVPLFASVTVADTADDVPPADNPASGSSNASAWNSVDITLGNGRRLTVDVRQRVQQERSHAIVEAIRYALGRWPALIRFLNDGRIELDNNPVERAIRPVALGRKNSLFAGSEGGARRWAIVASLIETAKRNSVEPFAWLRDALTHMIEGHSSIRLDEPMPWSTQGPVVIV